MPKGSVGIEFLNLNSPEWRTSVKDDVKFFVDSWAVAEKAVVASSDRVTKSRKKDADQHVKDFLKAEDEKQKVLQKNEKYLDGVRTRSIALANKQADAETKAAERSSAAQQKAAERTAAMQIKEQQRAQSAITQLIERIRAAQQKALDNAAKGSKSTGYSIFSGVNIGGQSKDEAIKAAIASRTKYEVELEGKKVRDIEKILVGLRKDYDIAQRAMQKSSDDRVKAELKQEMQATQEKIKIAMAMRNHLEGSGGKSLYGSVRTSAGDALSGAGIGLATGGVATAIGVGFNESVNLAARFETALIHLGNTTGITGSTLDSLGEKLRKTALAYNTELPDAIAATENILRSLGEEFKTNAAASDSATASVLLLAKAQGITADESAHTLTETLHQFGLATGTADSQAESLARITNVLAAASTQGTARIGDLQAGMKAAGVQAHEMGVSIEQTAAAVEILSKNGVEGSEAGSKFALFLSKIAGSTPEVEKGLKRIGLTYDQINPEKVGLNKSLELLSTQLNKVGNPVNRMEILTQVFGTGARGAAKIAEVLLSDVDAFQKTTDKITGTTAAQDQANKVMETAAEKYEHAKLKLEETATSIGQKLIPALESLATAADHAVGGIEMLLGMNVETDVDKQKTAIMTKGEDALKKHIKTLADKGIKESRGQSRAFLTDYLLHGATGHEAAFSEIDANTAAEIHLRTDAIIDQIDRDVADATKKKNKDGKKDNAFGTATGTDKNRKAFEAAKKIEDEKSADDEIKLLRKLKDDSSYTEEQFEKDDLLLKVKHFAITIDLAKKYGQDWRSETESMIHDQLDILKKGQAEEKKLLEARDKSFEIDYKFQLDSADQFEKKRLQLLHDFDKAAEGLNADQSEKINAQLTKDLDENEDAKNDAKLKKENEFQAKVLTVEMKGIENRVRSQKNAYLKDSTSEVAIEEERYNKSLEIQKNYYAKAILEAKADEKLLQIAKLENNEAEKTLLLEHLENLRKITDSANQEFKDLAKQTTESVFDPITQSMNNAIATMPKFVQTLIGGLEKILANKAASAIADLIFPSKKKSGVTNTGTPEEQSGGGSWIENNIPSFGEGGYTGDGSGTFLAKLHRGEVVLPPDIVAMIRGDSVNVNGAHPWMEMPDTSGDDKKKWRGRSDTTIDLTKKVEIEKGTSEENSADENLNKAVEGAHVIHQTYEVIEEAIEGFGHAAEKLLDSPSMMILTKPFDELLGKDEKVVADLAPGQTTMSRRTMDSIYAGVQRPKPGDASFIGPVLPGDSKNADGTVTANATEKGVLSALKIAQAAQQGGKKSVGNAAMSAAETGLALIPGAGPLAAAGLGFLGSIFGFKDGGDYDPTKPRIVGEEGPEIDYMGTIIPLGKRKGKSNLSSHLSDMAGRAAYSGGSSANASGISNEHLNELRSLRRSVQNLGGQRVSTRDIQINNIQDKYVQQRKKL